MKSIFTKVYLGMFVLILAGVFFSLLVMDYMLTDFYSIDLRRETTVEAERLEMMLMMADQSEWEQIVEHYEPVFDHRVQLLNPAQIVDMGVAFDQSVQDDSWFFDNNEDYWLFRPLIHGELYLSVTENVPPLGVLEYMVLVAPVFVFLLIFAAPVWFIARGIAKPIYALSDAVSRFGEGKMSVRADTKVGQPIGELAERFNEMAARIQTLIHEQQVILGAMPHELRGPLGRARFALDITRTAKSMGELRDQLETVDGYLDGLESVINNTLVFTRTQIDDEVKRQPFPLRVLIADICQSCSVDGKTVNWSSDDLVVHGDESLVRLVTVNLVENAVRYCRSQVWVGATQADRQQIVITVEDDGSGIPQTEQQAIFSPFYRIDNSRSRSTGGAGLGLAIVDVVAGRLGGNVTVSNGTHGGAKFRFNWPHFQQPS